MDRGDVSESPALREDKAVTVGAHGGYLLGHVCFESVVNSLSFISYTLINYPFLAALRVHDLISARSVPILVRYVTRTDVPSTPRIYVFGNCTQFGIGTEVWSTNTK